MKVDLDILANMLHPLFENIWPEGEMPNAWRCGLLIKLPKKGDTQQTVTTGGVLHFYLYQAVFTRVPLNRIKEHVNLRL
jgi:hypothetical protein